MLMRKLRGLRFSGFGETKTATEWARDPRRAISVRTLHQRLSNGEPLEEAMTRPAFKFAETRQRTGELWKAFGEEKTVRQWTQDPRCQVNDRVLRHRLKKGMNPEEAISRPVSVYEHFYEAFGETKSLKEWSQDSRCAVRFGALCQRLMRSWSMEDALTTPPLSKGCPLPPKEMEDKKPFARRLPQGNDALFEAFGESKTLLDWVKDPRCKVPYLRLRARLIKGWKIEDALSRVPAVGNRNVEALGESKSLYEWEKDPRCLVAQKTLRYRMLKGETLEEAMSRPAENAKTKAFWRNPPIP